MLKQNSELRAEARVALTDKWVMGAVTTLVFGAVSGAASYIPVVGTILVALPMMYGYSFVMLSVMRGGEMNIGGLFDGFNDFGRIVGTKLLQAIYTFLWTLLLVIPGIIKNYSYAMTDFILKDRDDVLNVFIHGNMPEKVKRICGLYNVTEQEAIKMTEDIDKRRMSNYRFYTDQKWGMASNYTLSLNSSVLGYEMCERIIMECAGR